MKKIILLLLLTAVGVSAQTYTFKKNQSDGKYSQFKSAGGDTTGILVYQVNPISGGSSGDLYVTQLGSSNSYAAWPSTTGTTIDSVSFSFTPKSITFINDETITDTLFVSSSSSFPTANTIRRLGGEGFTKLWSTSKLYYKVGTTPAASKKIRIEAN
jgi:hypothetical protein